MPQLVISEYSDITKTLVEALEAYEKKLEADLSRSKKNGEVWSVRKQNKKEEIQAKLNHIQWIQNEMVESGF